MAQVAGMSFIAKFLLKRALTEFLNRGFTNEDIRSLTPWKDDPRKITNCLRTLRNYKLIYYSQRRGKWYLSGMAKTNAALMLNELTDIAL
jgi:hypothetical protein